MGKLRRELRSAFQWKYSGAFIPLFFATGVAMALASRFAMAYAFFVLFGLWSIGYWLTGDFLRKKFAQTRKRETLRNLERYAQEMRDYRIWQITVVIGAIVLTLGFMGWTRSIKIDAQASALAALRDEMFDHLSVEPQPPQAFGMVDGVTVDITNGAHAEMDKHVVVCLISGLINRDVAVVSSFMSSLTKTDRGLLGGGRGETIVCKSKVPEAAPIVCGDMRVTVNFSVVGQPEFPQKKIYHFYYDKLKSDSWHQENTDARSEYCANAFGSH